MMLSSSLSLGLLNLSLETLDLPTITVYLEPFVRIDVDEVWPVPDYDLGRAQMPLLNRPWPTIRDEVQMPLFSSSVFHIRFRYVSCSNVNLASNHVHFIASSVCVPGDDCISMLDEATQSKAGSYSPIEWIRSTLIYLVDDEWSMQYMQVIWMMKWKKKVSAAAFKLLSWDPPKSIRQTL